MSDRISSQIRKIRKYRGMTQRELAQKIGCHWTRITKFEGYKGESITLKTIIRIANALDSEILLVPAGVISDLQCELDMANAYISDLERLHPEARKTIIDQGFSQAACVPKRESK